MVAVSDPDKDVAREFLAKEIRSRVAEERALFDENEDMEEVTIESIRQSFRQGRDGISGELRCLTSDWGFKVEDVGIVGVKLWYSDVDGTVSIQHGRWLAEHLPSAVLKDLPGETHMVACAKHMEEILRETLVAG